MKDPTTGNDDLRNREIWWDFFKVSLYCCCMHIIFPYTWIIRRAFKVLNPLQFLNEGFCAAEHGIMAVVLC